MRWHQVYVLQFQKRSVSVSCSIDSCTPARLLHDSTCRHSFCASRRQLAFWMQITSIGVSKRQKAGPHLVRLLLLICAGYYTGDRSCLTSFSVTILYSQALPAEVHSTFCGHHRMKSRCVKCSQLSCCTCSMCGKHKDCQQQPRSCCSEHGVTTVFDPQPRCASKNL